MSDRVRIGLDHPALRGRVRQSPRRSSSYAVVTRPRSRPTGPYFDQVYTSIEITASPGRQPLWPNFSGTEAEPTSTVDSTSVPPPIAIIKPEPFAVPAQPRLQRSHVLKRQLVRMPRRSSVASAFRPRRYSKLQLALIGMAGIVFVLGLAVTVQTLETNRHAAAQVSVLGKKPKPPTTTGQPAAAVPSTTKPTGQSLSQYTVAPDLPRYLKIPKLGVYARVLQVGLTKDGALGTPNNVYDTAWYTGSAKPGQPGAMLIDGHVSSWTAHGVFYGIKTLAAGDSIQVVRGDGAVLNYQVVSTQVYPAGNVDMQAAVTPVTASKPGLNLITCTGQVIRGTSEFNERVVVFAQQI